MQFRMEKVWMTLKLQEVIDFLFLKVILGMINIVIYQFFFQNAVESFLTPQRVRKEFWVKMLNPDVPVSIGYLRLVELFQLDKIGLVLTVNFDNCISKARNEINKPHYIDFIKSPQDYINISANGKYPQVIHLHGSYENYTDKNSEDEVKTLDEDLVDKVIPLLKDYSLIVIGYRGFEESIMKDLLIKNAKKANNYKNGIYWCIIKRDGKILDSCATVAEQKENLKLILQTNTHTWSHIKLKGSFDFGKKEEELLFDLDKL